MKPITKKFKIETWFEHGNIKSLPFTEYWNNENHELSKPFDIADGSLSKLEDYLESSVLKDDLNLCLRHATDASEYSVTIAGNGIDLACGNLWATAHVLRTQPQVKTMTCVDFSFHRLTKLGPKVIDAYKIPANKITLAHGSNGQRIHTP